MVKNGSAKIKYLSQSYRKSIYFPVNYTTSNQCLINMCEFVLKSRRYMMEFRYGLLSQCSKLCYYSRFNLGKVGLISAVKMLKNVRLYILLRFTSKVVAFTKL